MLRRAFLALALMSSGAAFADDIVDATGRGVRVSERIHRILPAGPPAAVLLAAVAPDLMLGWPMPLSPEAREFLPAELAHLPQIPRLTGHEDVVSDVMALKPDLIVDYGSTSPRYAELAQATQQRTGIPTVLLDGALARTPDAFRVLGSILHRQGRTETLARFSEALLALGAHGTVHPRVLCARGADGLNVIAPGTDLAEVFTQLGWQVVAPAGHGVFRQARFADIGVLDPDVLVFSDPAMRATLTRSEAWRSLRAVRDRHAFVAPSLPFDWVVEPPSVNRLLGFAWLSGHDPATLGAVFNAVVYGRVLAPAQLQALAPGVPRVAL